jgi:hypothetical protein
MAEPDLNGPTIPPPPGSVSHLDNPPNFNYVAIPIITLCAVLSAISFLIRFYAKYLGKKINVADCELLLLLKRLGLMYPG